MWVFVRRLLTIIAYCLIDQRFQNFRARLECEFGEHLATQASNSVCEHDKNVDYMDDFWQ